MAKKGFIMMTALPPTKGHLHLINWAAYYCASIGYKYLEVMVCTQPHEPYQDRWKDIEPSKVDGVQINIYNFHKTMPQQPDQDSMFWPKWQSEIFKIYGVFDKEDIVFSSEQYGYPLARVLDCKHVPVDLNRETLHIKASDVRQFPMHNFDAMVPLAQQRFRKTITIFGAESTGKTTLAKDLEGWGPSHYVHEWARPYLESLPTPEVTDDRMATIVHGQRAAEQSAKLLTGKPLIVRDTDLLSTVGYYAIYNGAGPNIVVDRADLYIVCPSNIPFVPDPLRYGGTVRESSDEFWIELLEKYKCKYTVLTATDPIARRMEALNAMYDEFYANDVWGYQRD